MELSNEALSVIAKVQKLLALAGNNDNEHQAAAASAKAMQLLEAYNLDMSVVGKTAKGPQGRKDQKRKGGLYGWQRNLWKSVAELNFCVYWSIRGLEKGSTYEHRILGSHANVVGSEVLADYLQQTVERLAKARAKEAGLNVFCRDMIAYREGIAARLSERLQEERRRRLEEEKAREAAQPSGNGTGLALLSAIHAEEDANNDYIHGKEPGFFAAVRAADMAKKAEAQRRANEALEVDKAWRLANPEEAAARDAETKAANEKWWAEFDARYEKQDAARERRRQKSGYYDREQRSRAKTAAEQRAELSTFREGYDKGKDISLSKQVDRSKSTAITN